MKYWFRPKRVGKWVAAYYPASTPGWLVTLALSAGLIKIFWWVDSHSHSGSDTLISFAPYFIAILLIYDLLCFRLGEYPWWWRKQK